MENCLAFKRRVQGLIDAGILRFDSANNATGNPFPNHAEGNVSTVGKEDEWKVRRCVSEIRMPLQKIWEDMAFSRVRNLKGYFKTGWIIRRLRSLTRGKRPMKEKYAPLTTSHQVSLIARIDR
ncbi:hypothetical protein GOBAR_AA36136 [Gossypium barbadense]|uniref:Uncharacterized protein n=1 Tax=Gossypium barbadense TaxID=3634 RepID=A0A2P5W0G1_GOSBA|nr:hypothetical protein GOBAR_AA36136 [Gossypium barbadense]